MVLACQRQRNSTLFPCRRLILPLLCQTVGSCNGHQTKIMSPLNLGSHPVVTRLILCPFFFNFINSFDQHLKQHRCIFTTPSRTSYRHRKESLALRAIPTFINISGAPRRPAPPPPAGQPPPTPRPPVDGRAASWDTRENPHAPASSANRAPGAA